MKKTTRFEIYDFDRLADVQRAERQASSVRHFLIALSLLLAVAILLVAESRLPDELRQGLFDAQFYSP